MTEKRDWSERAHWRFSHGTIPKTLGKLTVLERLELRGNVLTGDISEELGDLSNLGWLDLGRNQLTGAVPVGLSTSNNLEFLGVENNDLVETRQRFAGQQNSGVDGLDYKRYTECLKELFRNNKGDLLPAAVGIYAPWGSGKSFLLGLLKKELESDRSERSLRFRWWRNLRSSFTRSRWLVIIRFVFSAQCKPGSYRKQEKGGENKTRKSPSSMEAGRSTKSDDPSLRDFICVEFNAWECAASEVLWAALISKIFDTVEDNDEFGRGIVREKRIQNILNDYTWDLCGTATCFVLIAVLVLALLLLLAAFDVISGVAEAWESATALVLGVPGVLIAIQLLFQMRSVGVFDTAQSALRQAADRKQSVGESRLGFMSEVKKELETLFEVIKEYNAKKVRDGEGRGFTLAVVIDDLDRCPSDKIMLMLQAMHLLLEQQDAPMAVFLAVDPRILVSAIETSLKGVPDEVNGLHYLDKIIHIPFCIPRIPGGVRQQYVDELLNMGKETDWEKWDRAQDKKREPRMIKLEEEEDEEEKQEEKKPTHVVKARVAVPERWEEKEEEYDSAGGRNERKTGRDVVAGEEEEDTEGSVLGSSRDKLGKIIFRRGLLRAEGDMFNDIVSVVQATPRKIKRVMNVYVLQLLLAPSNLKEAMARRRFVKWTMLAEFWPFRLSCIVYAMTADDHKKAGRHRGSDRITVRSVYSKNGRRSVRGQIRKFRAEIRNKNKSEPDGKKMRDPYSYDESEDGFLTALGMGKSIPMHEEITQEMVVHPDDGFLHCCLNLNPAIVCFVEAAMEGDGL